MRTVQLARRFAPSDWGGTETVILETSKRLIARGDATEIVCTTATDPAPHSTLDGVEVTRLPYFYPYVGLGSEAKARLDKKGGSPFSFQLMAKLAMMRPLDLIHCHVGNRIGGIGRFVARRRGLPYVVSLHGGVFDVPPAEAASWTAPSRGAVEWGKALGLLVGSRKLLTDADAVLCVGKRESELAAERLPGTRVVHLPNGVDAGLFAKGDGPAFRREHNIPASAFVLLTVARIDGQKNQRLLIDALPKLRATAPEAHVVLVGSPTDAGYRQGLDAAVDELGLQGHVTIIDGLPARSPDLVNAFHAADTFVLPSIHEPFGIVVLEAWASGLPVVASRVGGIPHFVQDGVDGLLFPPGDRDALQAHIVELHASRERRASLAAAGKAKALESYSWDRITDSLQDEYRRAQHRARSRR